MQNFWHCPSDATEEENGASSPTKRISKSTSHLILTLTKDLLINVNSKQISNFTNIKRIGNLGKAMAEGRGTNTQDIKIHSAML